MTRISYLGSVAARAKKPKAPHVPGEFRLTKDFDEITDGEMDLLLARQRLEIEKENAEYIGGPFNWQLPRYDKAIGTIQMALDNIDNPAVIEGMGEEMERRAIAEGKNPAVGSIFKKIGKAIGKGVKAVGKGLKTVAKTVAKVALFIPKLIAKGIMEIYLPKASMMFLYLFADEKMLTDKMRAKRKKAEKFKNFVVKKLNMKEKHFMGIVRNGLTKKLKQSPESFLAKSLKAAAVKGIGGMAAAIGRVNKQKKVTRKQKKAVKNLRFNSDGSLQSGGSSESSEQNKETASNLVSSLSRGDVGGVIMAAINWIISKLGGKKEGIEVGADDLPDLEGDGGDAFNFRDLNEDYSNVNETMRMNIKDQATDMINQNYDYGQARQAITTRMPYLNSRQQDEIANEVEEGFEPITEQDAAAKARAIKMQKDDSLEDLYKSGGRSAPGMCNC